MTVLKGLKRHSLGPADRSTDISFCLCKILVFLANHPSWKEEGRDTKIGDGIIQDTSGDVIFNVQFEAIACKPEKDEVLDGKVLDVTSTGIVVQSGPISTFITMKVNSLLLANQIRRNAWSTNTIRLQTDGSKRTS